ncbi:MAG: hypothetical protein ACOCX2_05255, partial [Armatimonadota bacterium]
PGAGVIQWRLCAKLHAQTPWAERSRQAIEAALQSRDLSAEERAEIEAAADGPLPAVPKRNKPPCWQRLSIAQELLMVGVLDEGQAALEFLKAATVTRAAKGTYDESVAPKAEEGVRRSL